ncbi:MAG: DegV family protein [Actinomycetota bacterium]|nr:DegV family protein [Actinomycetota bacterium]
MPTDDVADRGPALTVGVVTDSAASLPADVAAGHKVTVVAMGLTLGGSSVHDGDLELEEVVARAGEGLTTSGPAPGEFAEAIAAADTGDGVVVLTISEKMSGTNGSARLAAKLEEDRVIRVVDTGTAAGAEGLVVLAAADRAATGANIDDVVSAAEVAAEKVRLVATLPTLEHLARGGRVPGAAAWAGHRLDLNPLFEFKGGHVRPLRPVRGQRAAQERIVALFAHRLQPEAALHVAALHALDPGGAEHVLDLVRSHVEPASAFVGSFSPVMVAHTGPGLVGLAWWWEERSGDGR